MDGETKPGLPWAGPNRMRSTKAYIQPCLMQQEILPEEIHEQASVPNKSRRSDWLRKNVIILVPRLRIPDGNHLTLHQLLDKIVPNVDMHRASSADRVLRHGGCTLIILEHFKYSTKKLGLQKPKHCPSEQNCSAPWSRSRPHSYKDSRSVA